jgi:sarcosine oxidase gamma subunit
MDYGLFDSVRDGQKLGAGDTEAFYALLAAMGRTTAAAMAAAATCAIACMAASGSDDRGAVALGADTWTTAGKGTADSSMGAAAADGRS